MPTGGGKSMCYQIPALCLPDLTIVISPLIALMEDQVLALKELGVRAETFNSNKSSQEIEAIYNQCIDGSLKLLYVSPEKLNSQDFQRLLSQVKISLIAVDESHCVSVWGNDFRPDYMTIHQTRVAYPNVPFIALTATADASTQKDICDQLHLINPIKYVSSFERKNILTTAFPGQKRIEQISQFVARQNGPGIIYCLSRKGTEEVARKMNEKGYKAAHYHAGMDAKSRQNTQSKFLTDEIDIICATIAFGMGIDKSNIGWVIHYNMPKNIEGYYQEIGRSGRDGNNAETLLFYSFYDYEMLKSFVIDSDANQVFKQVQMAKLDRMWEFATTSDCRTNIVLNYFGEFRNLPCGHCDNCITPPSQIDGTRLAQMALSAIIRCDEKLSLETLIGVLRGSYRQDIKDAGFTEVKTFGAGREYSILHWRSYIIQFINKGLFFIDYASKSRLRVTNLAKPVLLGKEKISIVEFQKNKPKPKVQISKATKEFDVVVDLFNELKSWRLALAKKNKFPPYVIFNDKTLNELAAVIPHNTIELLAINGIGAAKMEKYGNQILEITSKYENGTDQKNIKFTTKTKKPLNVLAVKKEKDIATTYLETYALLQQGLKPEEIAERKALNLNTIYNHLSYLYKIGKDINLYDYINQNEVDQVTIAVHTSNEKEKTKILFDYMNGEIPYYKIRLALTILNASNE
jgi:ATP-dependent DNA helicase RecQ